MSTLLEQEEPQTKYREEAELIQQQEETELIQQQEEAADKLWFGDYRAIGFGEQVKLQYPYRALISKTHKAALVFDIRPGAQSRLDRGICGEVSIDHTGAWKVQYAAAKNNPHDKEGYLPINEVLPLLGYGAANEG